MHEVNEKRDFWAYRGCFDSREIPDFSVFSIFLPLSPTSKTRGQTDSYLSGVPGPSQTRPGATPESHLANIAIRSTPKSGDVALDNDTIYVVFGNGTNYTPRP
jgi:hypothetical protein